MVEIFNRKRFSVFLIIIIIAVGVLFYIYYEGLINDNKGYEENSSEDDLLKVYVNMSLISVGYCRLNISINNVSDKI